MLDELQEDVLNGSVYLSGRLSERGRAEGVRLLQTAIEVGDDDSLAADLRVSNRLKATETRTGPDGRMTEARLPVTAPETLAEDEFNRFYIRGVCRRAIEDQIDDLIVYRAKRVSTPRPESEAKVGSTVDPDLLLMDMRSHRGVDTALGVPAGPNSGLSVRLP
jgi:hypothetical protein